MRKFFAFIFLFMLTVADSVHGATYNCKLQTIEQGAPHYNAAGQRTVSFDDFKTDVDKNDKYIIFLQSGYSYDVLVCGHERVDGCETYTTVAILGGHKIYNVSDVKDKNTLGIYKCSKGHSWKKATTNDITKCPSDISSAHFISKTGDGTNFYCKNEVYQTGDTKYCSDVCYAGAREMVSLKPKEEKPKTQNTSAQHLITVSGKIVDKESNETLPSVNILVVKSDETNTGLGTISNENGEFALKNVPPDAKLKISYIGYDTQVVNVSENVNIELVPANLVLDYVFVEGTKRPCSTQGGSWDNNKNTCICPDGRYWDLKAEKCYKICDFLNAGNAIDGIDAAQLETRKACCGHKVEIAKWEGDLKSGQCKCQQENTKWENNQCVKVENTEIANAGTDQEITCDDKQNMELNADKTECVCKNGYTKNAKGVCEQTSITPPPGVDPAETSCVKAGGIWTDNVCSCGENADWKDDKCVCKSETEYWDVASKSCKVNDKHKQEKACKELGSNKATWQNGQCVCVNEMEDWKYDSDKGTGACIENQEKKNKQNCEKLGTDVAKWENNECVCIDEIKTYDPKTNKCEIDKEKEKAKRLADKQKAYDEAKAKEQSTANKMLGGLTTAATGLGAMELMQGLSEQKADDEAAEDMAAYLATFRCTYAGGKSVQGGVEPIELPGGNDKTLMELRNEYIQLAASLKERKESLGMKPGIESEEILDKAEMGLYDDENVGISKSQYASLYRAQTGNAEDQAKIDADKSKSDKRVKGGAIAAGIGVVGGIVGDSLINGKLGDKIKEAKADKQAKKKESDALDELKKCLKDGGATNTDNLKFNKFTPSVLDINKIDCKGDTWKKKVNGKDATKLFEDSEDADKITKKISESFGDEIGSKLLESFLE